MLLAFIGGGVGTLFQWLLLGGPQFEDVAQSARIMAGSSNVGYYMRSTLLNVVLNLLDKTASIVIAFMIIRLMPKGTVKEIWFSSWKQNPLTNEEVDYINRQSRKGGIHSLRIRIIVMLSFAMVTLTIIMASISINLQFENTRNIQSTHSMLQNLQHLK